MKEQVIKETVEAKLVNMLDALQNGVAEIGNTAVKYAPDVMDAALQVVRIDGIQNVATALYLFVLGCISLGNVKRFYKKAVEDSWDSCWCVAPIGAVLAGGVLLIQAMATLTNIWVWVSIFEPKLYIAKQIIKTTIGE
jgi:hypothetical protein